MPPGCSDPQLEAGEHRRSLVHGDMEREYLVVVPEGAATGEPAPLLVSFHGYTGNLQEYRGQVASDPGTNPEDAGYVVIYPQGVGSA